MATQMYGNYFNNENVSIFNESEANKGRSPPALSRERTKSGGEHLWKA